MTQIVDRGIFQKPNGFWCGNSPIRDGYYFSLHTRDEAKARKKYDELLESLRRGERELDAYDRRMGKGR